MISGYANPIQGINVRPHGILVCQVVFSGAEISNKVSLSQIISALVPVGWEIFVRCLCSHTPRSAVGHM